MSVVDYCDWLAKKNSEALSFIPRPKLEDYLVRSQILTEFENDELCGFLVFGNGFPYLRVYQACIQHDSRLRQHGLNLVKKLTDEAIKRKVFEIRLRCAQDLEANDFWKSAGFQLIGSVKGGNRRGRIINQWSMEINKDPQFTLFDSTLHTKG